MVNVGVLFDINASSEKFPGDDKDLYHCYSLAWLCVICKLKEKEKNWSCWLLEKRATSLLLTWIVNSLSATAEGMRLALNPLPMIFNWKPAVSVSNVGVIKPCKWFPFQPVRYTILHSTKQVSRLFLHAAAAALASDLSLILIDSWHEYVGYVVVVVSLGANWLTWFGLTYLPACSHSQLHWISFLERPCVIS